MDDLEQRLQSARLAAPSAELDRRLDQAFRAARRPRRRSRPGWFWWSLAGVTAAGAMAALLFASIGRPPPAPRQVVYRIEARGALRQMLLDPAASREGRPHFVVRVETR